MEDSFPWNWKENKNLYCLYVPSRHEKTVCRTILGFKADYPDWIDEAFKTTLKFAKKNYHVSLDGTKVKVKTSKNNITNEQQLKRILYCIVFDEVSCFGSCCIDILIFKTNFPKLVHIYRSPKIKSNPKPCS